MFMEFDHAANRETIMALQQGQLASLMRQHEGDRAIACAAQRDVPHVDEVAVVVDDAAGVVDDEDAVGGRLQRRA